jgi:hypothetical protein
VILRTTLAPDRADAVRRRQAASLGRGVVRRRLEQLRPAGASSRLPQAAARASAVEVQEGMAERNAEVPADRRIEFRIGSA